MKSKFVNWLVWPVVVGLLLQSCSAAPATAIPPAPTAASVAGTPTTPAATPTAVGSTATRAPSLTPSLPAPTLTLTATPVPRVPWLISAENLVQFKPLASLGNNSLDLINLAVWAPNGLRLAVGGKTSLVMFDAVTWKVLWQIEFPDAVNLQFSQDSTRLLVGRSKGETKGLLLDSATGKILTTHYGGLIALNPDGKTVAGAGSGTLSNELIRELSQPKLNPATFEAPEQMAFSQDGRKLVTGLNGGGFTAWDVTSGEITYNVAGNDPYKTCQGESAASDWMVLVCAITSTDFSKVSLQANFINLNRPNGFGRYIFSNVADYKSHHFALLPDQPLIAWADGSKITLYDLAAGFQPVRTLPGLPANGSMSFGPGKKDQRMAYWNNRNLQIWDVSTSKKVVEFGGPPVTQMTFNPNDGRLLAFGKDDGSVALWNVAAQERLFLYQAHRPGRVGVAFMPDGKGLASGGIDYTIRLWKLDPPDPKPLIEQKVMSGIAQFAFTPDGKKVAVTYISAYLVHLYSGSLDVKEPLQNVPVSSASYVSWVGVAASPNSTRLAFGNTVGLVEVHDAANGALLKRFESPQKVTARHLVFSADSGLLAVSGRGLWNLRNDNLMVELDANTSSVALSPDQCLLAAGQTNGTLRLWNVATGLFLEPLKVFESGVEDLAFSPDGRLLAMANQDGDVVIWGMPNALKQPAGEVPKVKCRQ